MKEYDQYRIELNKEEVEEIVKDKVRELLKERGYEFEEDLYFDQDGCFNFDTMSFRGFRKIEPKG